MLIYTQTHVGIDCNTSAMSMAPVGLSWDPDQPQNGRHVHLSEVHISTGSKVYHIRILNGTLEKHTCTVHAEIRTSTQTQYMLHLPVFGSFPGADKVCALP